MNIRGAVALLCIAVCTGEYQRQSPLRPSLRNTPVQKPDPPNPPADGKDGKDGQDGEDGQDGRGVVSITMDGDGVITASYTDNTSEVVGQLQDGPIDWSKAPPIYPQWIDTEGNVIDSIPGGVRLGDTMPLRISVETIREIVKQEIRALDANSRSQ